MELHHAKDLYFGESNLLESLNSIIKSSLYFMQNPDKLAPIIVVIVVFVITVIFLLVIIKKLYLDKLGIIMQLFFFIAIGFLLQNFIWKTKFPSERTFLFFIPIFGLGLYYFQKSLADIYRISNWKFQITNIIFAIPLYFHFISSINNFKTKTWIYDASTKMMMDLIVSKMKEDTLLHSISNSWELEPTINYYISSKHIPLIPANREGINFESDFIITKEETVNSNVYTKLVDSKISGTQLWIKNK
jgi:hypothetical protein